MTRHDGAARKAGSRRTNGATAPPDGEDAGRIAGLRWVLARNPSPYTLTGTRTYIIGHRDVAVIDPGPALPEHVDAIAERVADRTGACILVTHGHPDHAAAARTLADRLDAPVHAAAARTLAEGDRFETDAGELIAVATPGHTPDHVAFHWSPERAVFCGDLLMGGLATTLVAAPEGDLGAYLASLERVRGLAPRVIYPAHGSPFTEPATALDTYVRHRAARQRDVLAALEGGARGVDTLTDAVYGPGLQPALRRAADGAIVAYLRYLEARGEVRRASGGGWTRTGDDQTNRRVQRG